MGAGVFRTAEFSELADRVGIVSRFGHSPGQIFYVDSATGASTKDGRTKGNAKATWAQAYALCDGGKGDVIILMPGHAETLSITTQGILLNKAGVLTIGSGVGNNRPAITCGAAAVDAISVSAASNHVENIRIIGHASCTALVNTTTAGDDLTLQNIVFDMQGLAAPLDMCTFNGDRLHVYDSKVMADTGGPDIAFLFETQCKFVEIKRCDFLYGLADIDEAFIKMTAGVPTGMLIQHCNFLGAAVDKPLFLSSVSTASIMEGMVCDCNFVANGAATSMEDHINDTPGSIGYLNVFGTDVSTGRGVPMPLVSAS